MRPDGEKYISAHSAAAQLVRKRVESGAMTPDQAVQFTDWIYMMVNTGQLPDDPRQLGLIETQWKVASSVAQTTASGIDLSV